MEASRNKNLISVQCRTNGELTDIVKLYTYIILKNVAFRVNGEKVPFLAETETLVKKRGTSLFEGDAIPSSILLD